MDQGKCSPPGAGRPILGSSASQATGGQRAGDKHTRHHHTTSPEKQEDNINPSRRYVLCRWDPSSRKTRWSPDSSSQEVGDRERHEREKKNKTKNISTHIVFNSVPCVTEVLSGTDHRSARSHPVPPNPGHLAT